MANYRIEIDALNALIDEQKRTNELLEKLLEKREEQSHDHKLVEPVARQRRNVRGVHNAK